MTQVEPIVAHYLERQVVWTYVPDRWPEGVITADPQPQGLLAVRHVVAFRPGILRPMLQAGLEAATLAGWVGLIITIPVAFPPARALLRVAQGLGFEFYASDAEAYHVVRYL